MKKAFDRMSSKDFAFRFWIALTSSVIITTFTVGAVIVNKYLFPLPLSYWKLAFPLFFIFVPWLCAYWITKNGPK